MSLRIRKMKTASSTLLIFGLSLNLSAQPYIDVLNVRYLHNFTNGTLKVDNYNINTTLPLVFKKSKNAIILSPYYEHWNLSVGQDHNVQGLVLPISFLKNLSPKWSIVATELPGQTKKLHTKKVQCNTVVQ